MEQMLGLSPSNMETAKKSGGLPGWFVTIVIGRHPLRTLARVALLVIVAWAVLTFTPPIKVEGISMFPTYHDGQINFLNRLAFFHHEPQRGDVVGVHFKHTAGSSLMYLKRIVALPGETIAFSDGKLYIDGERVDEPYVKSGCDWNMPPLKLGYDEYYLVGDNRGMARTDHEQGVAARTQIVGKILFGGKS
jgi:signal peptidase I